MYSELTFKKVQNSIYILSHAIPNPVRIAELFKLEMEEKNREYEIFQECFMNTNVMKTLP